MITNYNELRDKALEMESLLINSYTQRNEFYSTIAKLNNICRNKDEKTKNPFIIHLQEISEQELNDVRGKAEEFEIELKKKVEDFLDTVKQFINSEYSNNTDYYKKEGENNSVIEQKLKRLYEIEKSIPDIKIVLSKVENDPGEIYEAFVYNIRDLTSNEEKKKKAEKLYNDALKYLSELGEKDKDKDIYVYTDMLAERFKIKDKDTVVALKNMLIDSEALSLTGTINIFKVGNLVSIQKDKDASANYNTTEPVTSKNKKGPELMPFFGEDCSR